MKRLALSMGLIVPGLMLAVPGMAAGDDLSVLRSQLEAQQKLIKEQSDMLKLQQQKLDQQAKTMEHLSKRLDQIDEESVASVKSTAGNQAEEAKDESQTKSRRIVRDSVGDLNAEAVKEGVFPGSLSLPGSAGISLAIGGFVKTAAIFDSKAEKMGADFLPATLGTRSQDEAGATSLDATLTRLNLDGRAPVADGSIRGYVEYDLNKGNDGTADFKLRHAYGTWANSYGTLTAGQTWSTAMDLKNLPEGLTEPTVSGVIFQRQALVRWSQPLSDELMLHAAIEDPNSNDVFSTVEIKNQTSIPDSVLGLDYDHEGLWHVRLNGLLRNLKTELPDGGDDSTTAWGATLSGHLNIFGKDKLGLNGVYGEGVGRYLLGIQSSAGAVLDPSDNTIETLENWGVMTSYEHHWADNLRSTAMIGYAQSEPLDWQPDDTFESSTYGAVNLMWNVHRYITLGIEYAYGNRENFDGSDMDNHRIVVGMQFF